MQSSTTTVETRAEQKVSVTVPRVLVAVALAWLVPVLVHLVPWSGPSPLGAVLLPLFWMTVLATWSFGVRWGIGIALAGLVTNSLGLGLPALAWIGQMALELSLFALLANLLMRKIPVWACMVSLAWLVAHVATGLVMGQGLDGSLAAVAVCWPGLAILTGLAVLAQIFLPPSQPRG